jgi:hypothetical protein
MAENSLLFLGDEDETKVLNNDGSLDKLDKQKVEDKLKIKLFGVFYVLIKGLDISSWKFYLLIGIEFLEFLSFSIHPTVKGQWNGEVAMDYISTAF